MTTVFFSLTKVENVHQLAVLYLCDKLEETAGNSLAMSLNAAKLLNFLLQQMNVKTILVPN